MIAIPIFAIVFIAYKIGYYYGNERAFELAKLRRKRR